MFSRIKEFFLSLFSSPKKTVEAKNPLQSESSLLKDKKGEHLRFLSMLQESGRLIDFLKEDLTGYTDEQIGSAVRKIQQDCSKCLEEWVTIRPLLTESEGSKMTLPASYDPQKFKVIGTYRADEPFKVVLRHRGWKAHKMSLPPAAFASQGEVLMPAEVEVE